MNKIRLNLKRPFGTTCRIDVYHRGRRVYLLLRASRQLRSNRAEVRWYAYNDTGPKLPNGGSNGTRCFNRRGDALREIRSVLAARRDG